MNSDKIIINCVGDSVTEGMATEGHHTSEYGKSPYPARLYTLLKDNGYDVEVNNYGHGGECFPDIVARIGGIAAVISQDLIVPDNIPVSLGRRSREKGKNLETKLKLCYADESGEDLCVYFTQMSHDTNPVTIDGKQYIMSVKDDNENLIEKAVPDGEETIIPAGSLLFTANKRTPDVNIFYGGINDGESFTLKKFIDFTKKCGEVNGGRYIVLGSTHPIFERWSDVAGTTNEEKYKNYRRACVENFGIHFIDLYDEFSRHGVDMVLEAGYLRDKTAEDIKSIREKLKNHIIPKEFTYNKESENDVHLSQEGYHVIAKLIFERLKLLGYIKANSQAK